MIDWIKFMYFDKSGILKETKKQKLVRTTNWCQCNDTNGCGYRNGECKRPVADYFYDSELDDKMEAIRTMCGTIFSLREQAKINKRTPISIVNFTGTTVIKSLIESDELQNVLARVTNVKEFKYVGESYQFQLAIEPIRSKIGPMFKQKSKIITDELMCVDPSVLQEQLKNDGSYQLPSGTILPDMVRFRTEFPKEIVGADFKSKLGNGFVFFDRAVPVEMQREGTINDIGRMFQQLRKEAKMKKGELASAQIKSTDSLILEILKSDAVETIKKRANLTSIQVVDQVSGDVIETDDDIVIGLTKVIK